VGLIGDLIESRGLLLGGRRDRGRLCGRLPARVGEVVDGVDSTLSLR
jgi:hypothetical protein